MSHCRIEQLKTSRGTFAVRRGGQSTGTPILCLHGFPDDASTFDQLATALEPEGYHVIAMYLRGYSPSTLEGPYDLPEMAEDVLSVLDTLGLTAPVHLVGHDYGAQIVWAAMAQHPDRFRATVALAGAHPASIAHNARRHPTQAWLSRYIIFFQLGRLADRVVAKSSFAYIDRLWARWSPHWTVDPGHLNRVKATLAESMPAPIAMYRGGGFGIRSHPVHVPTLFICGEDDKCSLPQMSDGQERLFAETYRREIWPDTGHFPHLEHPDKTARTILHWFQRF